MTVRMLKMFLFHKFRGHMVFSRLFFLRLGSGDEEFICFYNKVIVKFIIRVRVDNLVESLLLLAFIPLDIRLGKFSGGHSSSRIHSLT